MSGYRKEIHGSPDRSQEQEVVKDRLDLMRSWDLNRRYVLDRNSSRYLDFFGGIAGTFDYARQLETDTVTDIGAGTTRAVFELSQLPFSAGLNFRATVLSPEVVCPEFLDRERIHVTSAEDLSDFQDGSIGVFLALYSIGYSASPRTAIERINEKLCEGGILKAVFEEGGRFTSPHTLFEDILKELKYSLGYLEGPNGGYHTILGIKPGGAFAVDAMDLVSKDKDTLADQHIQRKIVKAEQNRNMVRKLLCSYPQTPDLVKDAFVFWSDELFWGERDTKDIQYGELDEQDFKSEDPDILMKITTNVLRRNMEAYNGVLFESGIARFRRLFLDVADKYAAKSEHGVEPEKASHFRQIAENIPLVLDVENKLKKYLWTD